jgi:hypothetical protein
MKEFNLSDMILPAGLLYIIYKVGQNFGLIAEKKTVSTAVSGECPRGKNYSRGYFETCDPNYLSAGNLFNDTCDCMSDLKTVEPSKTPIPTYPDPTQSPVNSPTTPIWDWLKGLLPGAPPTPTASTTYSQPSTISSDISPLTTDYQAPTPPPSALSILPGFQQTVSQQLGIYTGEYGGSGSPTPATPTSNISNEELAYAVATSPTGQISPSSPYYSQYQSLGGGGGGAR